MLQVFVAGVVTLERDERHSDQNDLFKTLLLRGCIYMIINRDYSVFFNIIAELIFVQTIHKKTRLNLTVLI